MSSPRPASTGFRQAFAPALLTALIGALALGVTIHYIHAERFFYFWDNFAYNRASLESLGALQDPGTSWWHHLRVSMQSGFSQLFTVVTAPMMAWLGESRTVFITSIVGFYLLPCAGFATLLVHRIAPLRSWQWPIVFVACGTLPVFWRASLSGYPDVGGMTLALATMYLITTDLEYRRWTTAAAVGLLVAAVFLFRRHLVYCIFALMLAASLVAVFRAVRAENGLRFRTALLVVLRLAFTTLLAVFLIWLMAPSYFSELVGTNFRELYLPFQCTVLETWRQHWNYIGSLYWGLALIGFVWGWWSGAANKRVCAFLLIYLVVSLGIWVFYLRYLSVQYNLHFAVVLAMGVGLLAVLIYRRFGVWASLALAVVLAVLWLDRLSTPSILPVEADKVLPARLPPLRNPDYDEIKRLILFLRSNATAPHNNILVASSSGTLNSDMLTVGEGALFGRSHRQMVIMNGSHADTVQPYSLRDMVAADWIVVADPFQHHLRVEDQGVVLSILQAMEQATAFARDFKRLDATFQLSQGIAVHVYQRIAPTALPTQVQTARLMFETVGTTDAWSGPFMMGEAATGAEYFDARLLVPSAPGKYTAQLEQIRLGASQNEVVIFVRLEHQPRRKISGKLDGFSGKGITLNAEFFPDDPTASPTLLVRNQSVAHADKFEVVVPDGGAGVVALRLIPQERPPAGSPLGLAIYDLAVQQQ